jgi:predicted nucleic acid-binding Zn ribbon protein
MSKSSTCIQCSADFVIKPNTTGLYCSPACSIPNQRQNLIDRAANLRMIAELEYLKNPKLCCHCEAPIPFAKRSNKFCSRSCSASFGNIGRIQTEESREKISTTLKTRIASGEIVTPPKKFGKESGNYKHGKCIKVISTSCIICGKPTTRNHKTCSKECRFVSRQQAGSATNETYKNLKQTDLHRPYTKIIWKQCAITGKFYHGRTRDGGRRGSSPYSKDLKHIYQELSKFKFNVFSLSDLLDIAILKKHGWYNTGFDKNNNNKPKNADGVSRDHLYSVSEGLKQKIHPLILSHPVNCQLVIHHDNISKHGKCDITIE